MKPEVLRKKLNLSHDKFANLLHQLNLDPLSEDIPDDIANSILDKVVKPKAIPATQPKVTESDIVQALNNLDIARTNLVTDYENTVCQEDNLIDEGLIQSEIEGSLAGELEGITFLQSYNKGRLSVIREYTKFRNASHDKFIKTLLDKYAKITSESEEVILEDMENAEKHNDFRTKWDSKKR